jgi:putative ABC transport system ATP-binding protein
MDSPGGSVAVRATQLVKSYVEGPPPALRRVDLTVDQGSFLSVMGPSGSGKSTLLHLIGGLDRPTSGDVVVSGTSLGGLDDNQLTELRRTGMGFVFQAFNLVPVLTTAENVALPAVIAGLAPKSYADRLDEVLALVGLADHRDKLPSQLSGGEQQRVAVARALLLEPPLILADEPTGNLDSSTGRDVLGLLRRAVDTGATVVMVTHDAGAAANADAVVMLRDGSVMGRHELDGTSDHEQRRGEVLSFLATHAGA